MLQIGNQEITVEQIAILADFFELKSGDDDDALYLKPKRETYHTVEVKVIVQIIGELAPDECDFEGDYVRLWWD